MTPADLSKFSSNDPADWQNPYIIISTSGLAVRCYARSKDFQTIGPDELAAYLCHWPEKFEEARVKVTTQYSDDEKNTALTTALLLKVGGVQDNEGNGSEIHWWHMDPFNQVTYIADEKRQTMFWVQHKKAKGTATEYQLAEGVPSLQRLEKRVMDCVDCHNRPTHIYRLPEESIDIALAAGQIDTSLPFIKKQGVALLKATYANEAEAREKIRTGLEEFYFKELRQLDQNGTQKIEVARVQAAIQTLQERAIGFEPTTPCAQVPLSTCHALSLNAPEPTTEAGFGASH